MNVLQIMIPRLFCCSPNPMLGRGVPLRLGVGLPRVRVGFGRRRHRVVGCVVRRTKIAGVSRLQ